MHDPVLHATWNFRNISDILTSFSRQIEISMTIRLIHVLQNTGVSSAGLRRLVHQALFYADVACASFLCWWLPRFIYVPLILVRVVSGSFLGQPWASFWASRIRRSRHSTKQTKAQIFAMALRQCRDGDQEWRYKIKTACVYCVCSAISLEFCSITLQDAHLCNLEFDKDRKLFGVFDGHAGKLLLLVVWI